MRIDQYLKKHAMSQEAFAKSLGVTQGLVWQWVSGRQRVTAERAIAIERATDAAIMRHELRPDIFGPAPSKERAA